MPNSFKSNAKRMGVKSVFSNQGDLVITTFGKGNKADVAFSGKEGGRGYPMPHEAEQFTITKIDEKIDLERGPLAAILDNPVDSPRDDYLHLKANLEEKYYGKTFPNDTIRIQIIYNLLGIQKIFGLYVTDIIHSINNLQSEEDKWENDLVGLSLRDEKKVDDRLEKMLPYLALFGDIFQIPARKARKPNKSFRSDKEPPVDPAYVENRRILRTLGGIRQLTAHGKNSHLLFTDPNGWKSKQKKDITIDQDLIEDVFRKRVETVNKGFLEHSKRNLKILFDYLGAATSEEKKQITREYYKFSILKEGKNLGINVTKLREYMLEKFCPEVFDKKNKVVNTYRQKLYVITDFILLRALNEQSGLVSEKIEQLRSALNEDEKEDLYRRFAVEIWPSVKETLQRFFKEFHGKYDEVTESDNTLAGWVSDVQFGSKNVPWFVKLLSFMCSFLEGKEINELLTAFIHCFENIESFNNVLNNLGETNRRFNNDYFILNKPGNCGLIAQHLRVLASIGKMKGDMAGAKRLLYRVAIQMIGAPKYLEDVSDEWLAENVLLDPKAADYRQKKSNVNPFRNFIAKNVINSRRFLYLVRYTDAKTVRQLMSNRKIVRYVLERLPEKQIDSYYSGIAEAKDDASPDLQRDALTDKLVRYSFQALLDDRQNIVVYSHSRGNSPEADFAIAVEKLKALTGLYLTVAYVAVKNLVKVNARYFIAFSAFERDNELLRKKDAAAVKRHDIRYSYTEDNGKQKERDCQSYSLTRYFLAADEAIHYDPAPGEPFDREACHKYFDEHPRHFTKRYREYFHKEIGEALEISPTGYLAVAARNNVEHLNVLASMSRYIGDFRAGTDKPMTSYFDLFHYLLQRMLIETEGLQFSQRWTKPLLGEGVPNNDLIHTTFVSLAYCLPRYKNLTTEALFDTDSVSGKARAKRIEENSKGKGKKK